MTSAPLFDENPIPGEPAWKDAVIRRRTPPFVSSVWPLASALIGLLLLSGLQGPTVGRESPVWAALRMSMLVTVTGVSYFLARYRFEGVQPTHHRVVGAARTARL